MWFGEYKGAVLSFDLNEGCGVVAVDIADHEVHGVINDTRIVRILFNLDHLRQPYKYPKNGDQVNVKCQCVVNAQTGKWESVALHGQYPLRLLFCPEQIELEIST